jgi:hypothetical protein
MKLLTEDEKAKAKPFPSTEMVVFKGVKHVVLEEGMVAMYPNGATAPAAPAPAPAPATPAPAPAIPDERMARLEKDMLAMKDAQAKAQAEKEALEKQLAEKAKEIENLKKPAEPATLPANLAGDGMKGKKVVRAAEALCAIVEGRRSG